MFIRSTSLFQKIVLITSASSLEDLSPHTHGMVQLIRIFAYHNGEDVDHQLMAEYTKVTHDAIAKLVLSMRRTDYVLR